MKKIFISIFFLLITSIYAKAEIEKYSCVEVKTDLAGNKVQYGINKENYAEFEIKDCVLENLKIHVKNRSIIYKQSRRIIEDGRIEKNDLFAIECSQPFPEDADLTDYEGINFNFYRGKITPLINPEYPLYPTLKQTAEKLNLETPHRTFITFSGLGGASHEFFCYIDKKPSTKPLQDKCLYTFDEVLDIHEKNKNTVAIENLAEKYLKRLDYEKAEKAYKKAVELSDKKDLAQLLNFYLAAKQYNKAKEILLKEIENSPYDPLSYISLANIYLYERELDKAEYLVQKALNLRFDNGLYKAYGILGEVYVAERNYNDAVTSFEKAIKFLKEECESEGLLNKFFYRGDVPPVDCEYKILPYQLKIIHALIELEDLDRAEKLLNGMIAKNPNEPSIYGHFAYLYASKGNFNKALKMADKAVSLLKSRGIGVNIVKGEIYPQIFSVRKNSPAERGGLKKGDKIINIDGKDLRLFREKGDIVKMLVEYINKNDKIRLTIHSENSTELKNVELIPQELLQSSASQVLALKALILRSKGDYREFEELSLRAEELNPEDRLTLTALALVMAHKKRYNEAFEIMEKLEKGGSDSLTLLIKPLIYAKSGQIDKAKELYQEIHEELIKTKNALYKNFLAELKKALKKDIK
ncbi:PDZ domain-containing protein [Thermodesulfovibrio sp. 3907-1M]|uniref:PDZ domain-containing protein n=1 Tax=Thermodesulfovibrio autotrophicus TaxID=3118333 RepID=A0AAU8GUB3_9BACT